MRPRTLTAAGLVATLACAACIEAGPGAVAAVPEPEPGDPAVYAPDGWPLQIGDVPSGKELRDLSDRFGIWRSGFAPAPTLVEGRMHVARYAFDNTYLGHFPETFPDVLRPYEAELPPEFRGKVEYHRTPPRPPRHPHTDDGIVWVRLDENGRFVQVETSKRE